MQRATALASIVARSLAAVSRPSLAAAVLRSAAAAPSRLPFKPAPAAAAALDIRRGYAGGRGRKKAVSDDEDFNDYELDDLSGAGKKNPFYDEFDDGDKACDDSSGGEDALDEDFDDGDDACEDFGDEDLVKKPMNDWKRRF